jgi:hypothetical protein
MYDKTQSKNRLHDFDHWIGRHKICCQVKQITGFIESQKHIQSKMNDQK